MDKLEKRINELEIIITQYQNTLDEMNDELVKQWKIIDALRKENREIKKAMGSNIKSLAEETPPPHY